MLTEALMTGGVEMLTSLGLQDNLVEGVLSRTACVRDARTKHDV